jgi:TRAP-type C4-dicarboxylate transport system permease small subunit
MRKLLDNFFNACFYLAAFSMALMGTVVFAQVVSRAFGILIPSAPEIAGYSMASASFLALAHTFKRGGHVRVSLLIYALGKTKRRWAEIASLTLAFLLSVFFFFYLALMVVESYHFGEMSSGIVPIPLWIPQTLLTLGVFTFALAIGEALLDTIRGVTPSYITGEELAH